MRFPQSRDLSQVSCFQIRQWLSISLERLVTGRRVYHRFQFRNEWSRNMQGIH